MYPKQVFISVSQRQNIVLIFVGNKLLLSTYINVFLKYRVVSLVLEGTIVTS